MTNWKSNGFGKISKLNEKQIDKIIIIAWMLDFVRSIQSDSLKVINL